MRILTRKEYNDIFTKSGFNIRNIEYDKPIDVYHVDEWDKTVKNWENGCREDNPIEFFCAAKEMKDFIGNFINKLPDKVCYFACVYEQKYKMRYPYNDATKILYDELKKFLNSLNLRKNTNKSIEFTISELSQYITLLSFAGFGNISDFSLLFPTSQILIEPYHHMNYLIYNKDEKYVVDLLKKFETETIKVFTQ